MAPTDTSRPDLVLLEDNPAPEGAEIVWYKGRQGRRLRLLYAPEPKGGVRTRGLALVCPGRTEFIEKYFETARDLQARGFAVAIFDWPGQGLSDRLVPDPKAGHVAGYSVYVDALIKGLQALGRRAREPYVILAHSMGGAIALEALRSRRLKVAAAAFSAPMWGLSSWFFQRWFLRLARLFGFGARQPLAEGPEETFETNLLTHDERRWRLYRRLVEAEPALALGQPTIAWIVSSLDVIKGFFRPAALDHLRKTPVLVAIATEEAIVRKSSQKKLARRFASGKMLMVEGASHEILMETDERRNAFFSAFDELCRKAKI
jgi:lysophospholipase